MTVLMTSVLPILDYLSFTSCSDGQTAQNLALKQHSQNGLKGIVLPAAGLNKTGTCSL